MTALPHGIAHVSSAGAGAFLPARSPSDWQSLIESLVARARANGLVQVLVDDERWILRILGEPCRTDCCRCGTTVESACYFATEEGAPYCLGCVFARYTRRRDRVQEGKG